VLLVATETATLTVTGCGVVGLGIAGIAPTALSLAGIAVPSAPGAASGAALMGGYLGVALIPFAAGGIASIASVRVVLLVEIVFGLIVIFAALNLERWMQAESKSS
jgi:MFS family permease